MTIATSFVAPALWQGTIVRSKCSQIALRGSRVLTCAFRRERISCCALVSNVARLREQIELRAGEARGIFGMEYEDREALEKLISEVETESPVAKPTSENAAIARGTWRLLYTTLEILGNRRIRLAISSPRKPGLVTLGEFLQVIDPSKGETSNIVNFSVMGRTSGTFTVHANYVVENEKRVNVETIGTNLRPESLQKLLGPNEPLLLEIFNPQGYLDITFVDDTLRIGRNDKHLFVLEKIDDCVDKI